MYVLAEMEQGALALGRVAGQNDKFVMYLVNVEKGRILRSSEHLTEDELREILAENYAESASEIEGRIALAKAHPYTPACKAKIEQRTSPVRSTTSRNVRKIPKSRWTVFIDKLRNLALFH